jgi:hypothetical protein
MTTGGEERLQGVRENFEILDWEILKFHSMELSFSFHYRLFWKK